MAAIEIGQLPLTTLLAGTTFIPVENANITQKIEASSIRTFVTSLEFLNSAGNVTAANLVTTGRLTAADVLTSGQLRSTVGTGTAPLSVSSTTQVPNLYASRAAVADIATDGLITTTTFANIAATDIIVTGNYNALSANLRSVNTNVGTFGNTAIVPQLTVDNKGRITAISNVAITFPAQTLISNTSEITANTLSGTPGLNLTATGVTAGTYGGAVNVPQITVDAKGRVTNIQSIPVNSTLNTLNIGIPIGTIAIWSGPLSTIPDGWQICDGTNGTVDLRNRFVVGAGSLYNPGTTGGSADAVLPSHTHTATSTSTFTGESLPPHAHGITDPGHTHVTTYNYERWNVDGPNTLTGGDGLSAGSNLINSSVTGISINSASGGTPSGTVVTSTTLSTEGVTATNRNLPPYYALYYIQKMTDSVSINNPINYMSTIGTVTSGGNLVAASGNASISTTTGALVVVGGAGVSGNLNVGGTSNVGGNLNVSGVLIATTMPAGTANTAVATTSYVSSAISSLSFKANLDSPALTGIPTAPTAAAGTSTTQIATTAFVSSEIASAVPGYLRLIPRTNVFSSTATGVISVSLPTTLFENKTPSFVMFSATAEITGATDIRTYYVCSGSTYAVNNIVLGASSDDTDQSGTATLRIASTFVLPYLASQNFLVGLTAGVNTYTGLNINVIGYQI